DKILNFLPFQSLVSPSNRYLIADYRLALSPSSNVLIACSDLATGKKLIGDESVLSVGITHFRSREDELLADLPSAAKEAKSIARFYKLSHPLIEGLASRSGVLSGMSNASVVHFASHFIPNPFSPLRSRLLLAKESQSTQDGVSVNSELASSEISQLKLNSVRLVVLSACQTGVERYYRGEGASSIARAFITAGVPVVVASLWPVDSDATAELMIRFHRFRKQNGLASVEALRSAQRSMVDDQDLHYSHPYYWASFNLIGGVAEY
ncbi:MAG: CHAT domain-containing protein, partial [Blastocatellia bacterium]